MKKGNIVLVVITIIVIVVLFLFGISQIIAFALRGGSAPREPRGRVSTGTGVTRTLTGGDQRVSMPREDYVGVVNVFGVIEGQMLSTPFGTPQSYQHMATLEFIDIMMQDDNNVGLLLNINSPGGTVYEGEQLLEKLQEYQRVTRRPIWAYMHHLGASAAYLIATPADRIYANRNTLTGSLGVMIAGYDLSGLYDLLGIRYYTVTSGYYKDMSSPSERQLLVFQQIIDEIYERLIDTVARERGIPIEEVRALADGRIFSSQQALNYGLIDGISSFEVMRDAMDRELGGVRFYSPEIITSTLATLFSRVEEIVPRSDAQIGLDLVERFGRGVPMMYMEFLD